MPYIISENFSIKPHKEKENMDLPELQERLDKYDQSHLLAHWNDLNEDEKSALFKELSELDFDYVTQSFERCVVDLNAKAEKLDDRMKPVPSKKQD